MSKPHVVWFSNTHEHSVHWCKLGLMRLADRGEIRLTQIPNELGADYLPPPLVRAVHRRKAVVVVEQSGRRRIAVLDGEDSIFQTSELIEHCDLYFVCAFRKSFFERESFDLGFSWQTEAEVDHYRQLWTTLQSKLGSHFFKARAFMPIGPNLTGAPTRVSRLQQKMRNLVHRTRAVVTPTRDWREQHASFEERFQQLIRLRNAPLQYDVVLRDSLWGWPRHRILLHRKLAEQATEFQIHSQLNYRECFDFEHAGFSKPEPADFPIISGHPDQGDYETMLASSRLAVFSTGFHWGCRNIHTLAWFWGLRVYSDPLSFEFPSDLKLLQTDWNYSAWDQLNALLKDVQHLDEQNQRKNRQAAFDAFLKPELVANQFLTEMLAGN
jgi:hypothetical protein